MDAVERFATDFGLARVIRDGDTIYMRGSGTDCYSYIATAGADNRFLGMAFAVGQTELNRAVSDRGAGPNRALKKSFPDFSNVVYEKRDFRCTPEIKHLESACFRRAIHGPD